MSTFKQLGYLLLLLTFTYGCSTTNSSLNPDQPHIYLNSFQEVIDATGQALQKASMRVYDAEEVDENTYHIIYYRNKYDTGGERPNPGGALMAEIYIERINDDRTRVTVVEEEESNMIPAEFQQKLGRDVLRQLSKLLDYESQSTETLAEKDH